MKRSIMMRNASRRRQALAALPLFASALSALALSLADCGSSDDGGAPGPTPGDAAVGDSPAVEGDAPTTDDAATPFPCVPGQGVFARCPANPIHLAGQTLPDGNLEISIGDPDTFFDEEARKWKMWWSTGSARSFATSDGAPIVIKYAESTDGIHWDVQREPVLSSGENPTRWDDTKVETPTVIKVPGNPPDRRFVMVYSGGNDADIPKIPGVDFTWYQLGIAFSPDGKKFTRPPASESPYATKQTPFRTIDGLLLLGRDAFPGVSDVGDGLVADPELVFDGTGYQLLFSSLATKTDRTADLAYGMSQARLSNLSTPTLTMASGNPTIVGASQPSVIAVPGGYELYLVYDTAEDRARVPTSFYPYAGTWRHTSTDLTTWSARAADPSFTFDGTQASERYGWVKAGDMAYRDGIRRYYYVAFGSESVPPGYVTLLRPDAGVALPDGSVILDGGAAVVPAVLGLHVAARRD